MEFGGGGYGGGYGGGAQAGGFGGGGGQFGGGEAGAGGFLASPPAGALETAAASPKDKRDRSHQSLIPVTIKQLLNAEKGHDDSFRIDGHELTQVSIVGLITSVSEQSTNFTILMDDGTGSMEVRFWVASEEETQIAEQKAQLREGVYVRAVGTLKEYMGNKSVAGFKYMPITDFNEVTYHFLQCVAVHLGHTKGPLPSASGRTLPGSAPQPAAQQSAYPTLGVGATTTTAPAMGAVPSAYGAPAPVAAGYVSGLNELHQKVLEVVRISPSAQHERGVHVDEILTRLETVANRDQIKQAVEFLTDQGHIFNTVDDDHVRCTS